MTPEQTAEWGFWNNWYTKRGGLDLVMRHRDYDHQKQNFEHVHKSGVGFLNRDESLLEVGMACCGLSPWLGRRYFVGADPQAHLHADAGVNYLTLGYDNVRPGTLEECRFRDLEFDLVVSCNCIDHDLDPQALVNEMGRVAKSRVFCAYDVRFAATVMHPGITDKIVNPPGFAVAYDALTPNPIEPTTEVSGIRYVLWERVK